MNGRRKAITVQVFDPSELGARQERRRQRLRGIPNVSKWLAEKPRYPDLDVRQDARVLVTRVVPPIGQKRGADEVP